MSYITLEDLRAEGIEVADYLNDEYIEGRIALAQKFIETITGRFFEAKAGHQLLLDGTGHSVLFLPIPPVNSTDAITEVKISDETLESEYYQYPLRVIPDDRFNPRLIKLSGAWPKGSFNISITGKFGFVESDESTPILIQDLCKRIAVWGLPPMGDKSSMRESQLIEEQLGDYRYRLSDAAQRGGFFGNPKIDNLIAMFKKRQIVAV